MFNDHYRRIYQVSILLDLTITLAMSTTSTLANATNVVCSDSMENVSANGMSTGNPSNRSRTPFDTSRWRHNLSFFCPVNTGVKRTTSALNRLSLCPWTYVTEQDYNRYPYQLVYARCTCGRCVASNGMNHVCRPVYQSIPIVRTTCVSGTLRYISTFEYIPVACVCAYRETVVVNKRDHV